MKHKHGTKRSKLGLPPGTLVYTGVHRSDDHPDFSLIKYKDDKKEISKSRTWHQTKAALDTAMVNWINVDGLSNEKAVEEIGNHFNIHSLVMEDVLNVDQLPKFEDHESYFFITMKMLSLTANKGEVETEHISFILTKGVLISFQEHLGDLFDPIRDRIEKGIGKITFNDADYLLYRLIDAIVDNYYLVISALSEDVSQLELLLLKDPGPAEVAEITKLKRRIMTLRRDIHPLREALRNLYNEESDLVCEKTKAYFNDVMDHLNHIIQDLEVQREALTGFFDLYNSNLANKMNGIMKTLTVITTIFIPLTFIVGVYGMNFKHMPELDWEYGYFDAWGLMLLTGMGMFYYMKRKEWL